MRFEISQGLLLLDMDGTLIDSAPDLIEAFQHLLRQHGQPPADEEQLRAELTRGTLQMLPRYFNVAPGEPGFSQLREQYLQRYQSQRHGATGLMRGMDELLRRCGEMGLPWGIATNKLRYLAEEVVQALRLQPAVLVCPDDVERGKPAPDMIELALERQGVAPQHCLYAGDHGVDQQAAAAAGVDFAAVSWGYGTESIQVRACALVAQTPEELLEWFGD